MVGFGVSYPSAGMRRGHVDVFSGVACAYLLVGGLDSGKLRPGHWTPLHLACLIPENLGFEGGFQWFRSLKRCFVCAWNWVTWSFAYLEPRKAPSPCPAGGQARAGLPWGDSEFFTDLFSTVVGSSAVSWLTEHPASGSP